MTHGVQLLAVCPLMPAHATLHACCCTGDNIGQIHTESSRLTSVQGLGTWRDRRRVPNPNLHIA